MFSWCAGVIAGGVVLINKHRDKDWACKKLGDLFSWGLMIYADCSVPREVDVCGWVRCSMGMIYTCTYTRVGEKKCRTSRSMKAAPFRLWLMNPLLEIVRLRILHARRDNRSGQISFYCPNEVRIAWKQTREQCVMTGKVPVDMRF